MKHEAKSEEMSFPQNKYILTMLKRRKRPEAEEMEETRKCPKHGEKEILYCREAGCQKMICPLCLSEAHLRHAVVAKEDERKAVLTELLKNIEVTSNTLNIKIEKVEKVSQDIIKKSEANLLQIRTEKDQTIQDLEKKKEDIIKQYDAIIKRAEDEKNKLNKTSCNELTAMKDNVVFLNSIKQSIEAEENRYEDAQKKLDTVKGVKENVKDLPRMKKFEYSEYIPGQEIAVGKLVTKEKIVLPAPELQGQVRQKIATGFDACQWFAITALGNETVAVCGEENKQWKLKCFSLGTGQQVGSTNLNNAFGMTEVEIEGRSAIAVSDPSKNQIEFHNKENLAEIVLTHSVGAHKPGRLCAVSPSVLVYSDTTKNPEELHWLDCSGVEPKLLGITVYPNLGKVQDMCVAESENQTLLIVIARKENVPFQAYDSTTGQSKWSAQKSFKSFNVEADNNGRLYVTDITNESIQMFAASDGQYLRSFIKRGDQGLGSAYGLGWCGTTPSLVVGHHHNLTQWLISDIH